MFKFYFYYSYYYNFYEYKYTKIKIKDWKRNTNIHTKDHKFNSHFNIWLYTLIADVHSYEYNNYFF